MSKSLQEAAADVLTNNVKNKRGQADKPQRLPGEVQDLGPAVVKPDTAKGPDASVGTSKDGSLSSQTGRHKAKVGAEKVHQMKNKQKVPMQEDEYLDDEDLLDEDEYLDDEDELTEAEKKKEEAKSDKSEVDTDPVMESDDEDEDDEDEDDDEDDDEDKKKKKKEKMDEEWDEEDEDEYELPSMDELDIDLSEDIEAMFEGQDLSEEFKDKITVIFEAAVRSNLKRYEGQLAEMFEESLTEAVTNIQEEMEAEVDKYLSYVVEEWVQDNEVAIESGLRNELAEDFMSGLRNLFVEHYIDIPEDKIDVVEELTEKLAEVEDRLNEQIERNVELNGVLKEHARDRVFMESIEGLTDVQAERMAELAEGVDFTDEEEYSEKLKTIKESYFPGGKSVKRPQLLDEDVLSDPEANQVQEEEDLRGPMAKYVAAIGKLKK